MNWNPPKVYVLRKDPMKSSEIIAFALGNKNYTKKHKIKNNIIIKLNKEKKLKSESISPDASWLE